MYLVPLCSLARAGAVSFGPLAILLLGSLSCFYYPLLGNVGNLLALLAMFCWLCLRHSRTTPTVCLRRTWFVVVRLSAKTLVFVAATWFHIPPGLWGWLFVMLVCGFVHAFQQTVVIPKHLAASQRLPYWKLWFQDGWWHHNFWIVDAFWLYVLYL